MMPEPDITISQFTENLSLWGCDLTMQEVLVWLRSRGYLLSGFDMSWNAPSELCEELGLLTTEQTFCYNEDGSVSSRRETVVTPKGRDYFTPRLVKYANANAGKEGRHHV